MFGSRDAEILLVLSAEQFSIILNKLLCYINTDIINNVEFNT